MTYFELFDIPVSLLPDEKLVKQKFYELSRKYHPDFFSNASEEEKNEVLEKSSLVNKAYKTFRSKDETIKYVLQQKGLLEEEEKYSLPPDFLMEMLELNEQLVEAKMSGEGSEILNLRSAISNIEKDIYEPVKEIIEHFREDIPAEKGLLQVKEYYFKKKYLNRILEGLK
jgi:molecular chaperone HscB